jgi:hypothetical protein
VKAIFDEAEESQSGKNDKDCHRPLHVVTPDAGIQQDASDGSVRGKSDPAIHPRRGKMCKRCQRAAHGLAGRRPNGILASD